MGVAALLLAGCTQPLPVPAAAALPAPTPTPDAVDSYVYASSAVGCFHGVCSGGAYPVEVYAAPDNASVQSLSIDVGAIDNYDQPVTWKLRCKDDNDTGPCVRALAEGQDKLPLHLERAGLHLDGGAKLSLSLTVASTTPVPIADGLLSFLYGSSHVTGQVLLLPVPDAPGNATAPGNGTAPG